MTAAAGPGTDEVHVRSAAYLVTVWPDGHDCPEAARWCLLVTDRGYGRWAVEQGRGHGDKVVLTRSGRWDLDRRGDPQYRFTLDEALALARQYAASLELVGRTAAEVMKEHAERGCPG